MTEGAFHKDGRVDMALRLLSKELEGWKKAGGSSTVFVLVPESPEEDIIVVCDGERVDAEWPEQRLASAMAKRAAAQHHM